jgi:hypothetical protein
VASEAAQNLHSQLLAWRPRVPGRAAVGAARGPPRLTLAGGGHGPPPEKACAGLRARPWTTFLSELTGRAHGSYDGALFRSYPGESGSGCTPPRRGPESQAPARERNQESLSGMREHNGDELEDEPQGTVAMTEAKGRSRTEPAHWVGQPEASSGNHLGSVIERIDSLELRLGGEMAKLRETVEIHSLQLVGKAIEAFSSLEADWVQAQSEASSLRERLSEATMGIGELQQQLDRIADLRRKAEKEAEVLRDDLQRELARALDAQRIANEQRDAAIHECLQMRRRLSWRITAPLRYVRSLFAKNHR